MSHDATCPWTADEALARLVAGNARFVSGKSRFEPSHFEFQASLVQGQSPYATIIGCSDSRVPLELIFDAGFNELFIVRIAGNVISAEVAGSVQYAAMYLKTPLFVVLGHEGCGAVQAALAARFADAHLPSRIELLLNDILPGLQGIDPATPPERQLSEAVEANVRWSMRQILDSPEGRARQREGVLKLLGAVYDLKTGHVRLLD